MCTPTTRFTRTTPTILPGACSTAIPKRSCAAVATEEIAKQDYILTPGRYVGIEEQEDDGEPFDEKMARLGGELSVMFKRSHELEDEIRKRLGAIGVEI
jgi:type I restriction enzyme M protein